MRHRVGKDGGQQGLRVTNGFHTIVLPPRSFAPPDMDRFEYLPQIKKAASTWPSPHKEQRNEEFDRAGAIRLTANNFLSDKTSDARKNMSAQDVSKLKKLTGELSRALEIGANEEVLKRLGNEILSIMPAKGEKS